MQPPEVALFLCGLITVKHLQCDLTLGISKNTLHNLNLLQCVTHLLTKFSWVKNIQRRFSHVQGRFLSLKPRLWCCGFVGQQKDTHLIPPTLPPLPKGLCIFFTFVVWQGQRPQSPKATLRAFIYLDPGKKIGETERKGVCCAKNEKTGKEERNSIGKIGMNERGARCENER